MAKYVIVPIVEGRGEVDAVPILLRGWLSFRRYRNVEVHSDGPVYANGKGNIAATHDSILGRGIEHYVRLALLRQPAADIILTGLWRKRLDHQGAYLNRGCNA